MYMAAQVMVSIFFVSKIPFVCVILWVGASLYLVCLPDVNLMIGLLYLGG